MEQRAHGLALRGTLIICIVTLTLTLQSRVAPAQTCPDDLCTCLGTAAQFGVVGNTLTMKGATQKYGKGTSAYVLHSATSLDDSACGNQGTFSGVTDAETNIGGDLVLLAGAGKKAATFNGIKQGKTLTPGTNVGGDLVTGGGTVKNIANAAVTGATDITGSSSKLADCTTAQSTAQSLSNTLKALPQTQTFAAISVTGKTSPFTISVVDGVNVINADKISVSPTGAWGGGELDIDFSGATDPSTAVAIINVKKKLSVGKDCSITVKGAGPDQVLINMYGTAKVILGKNSEVDSAILAPNANVSAGTGSIVGSIFGKNVSLQGTTVSGFFACP
jgi:choice-of-anchor A domain-containing protein